MTLNECIEKLMEMSVEDIKNFKKYEQIAELCKGISKVSANTTQSLQSAWGKPGFQETAVPKECISIPRGCCKSLFGDLTLREIDIEDRGE